MNIKKEFKNNLLKRIELEFDYESDSNPGYEGVKKVVSEKYKADEGLIVVKKVSGNFGSNEFNVIVFIYENSDAMKKAEPKPKEKGGKK